MDTRLQGTALSLEPHRHEMPQTLMQHLAIVELFNARNGFPARGGIVHSIGVSVAGGRLGFFRVSTS